MTRANRRACCTWSHVPNEGSGKPAGYCELCQSRTVFNGKGIYVCLSCGLEQDFHHSE